VCASFKQKNAKANLVFVTGLMESFIKYSETIQYYYDKGFNVFTYDHQSQGLSGRCTSPYNHARVRLEHSCYNISSC
jgi:alpha-beta hydrolase superfamily lysophospholipase